MAADLRILLVADSHLGFDLPVRPRVGRRRRGYDFLANYSAALAPALTGEIDLVVHAGDVFDRSRVVESLAYQAYEPLRRVADGGVPVFVVPGNHERSRLPHAYLASHQRIHIFDRPRTFVANVRQTTVSLSGFPYERNDVRAAFSGLLTQSGLHETQAAVRLLCVHHCVEGATVGPADFTFNTALDVIRTRDIPPTVDAVLSGHIHRHQVLTTALDGRRLHAPVLYPGSIERTSFAEMDEAKGFMIVHVAESEGDVDVHWEFRGLPTRPMVLRDLSAYGTSPPSLESAIHGIIAECASDAVVSIRLAGPLSDAHWGVVSPARLRAAAPETMNVEVRPLDALPPRRAVGASRRVAEPAAQLSLC